MKATRSSMGHDPGPKSTEACTYPVEVLPGPVAALVQAIVDVHGVPAAMSATIALSMLSASIGKGLLIMGAKGRRTMGNLFVLISAPTGVGKSTAINILRQPLDMILDYLQECADSHCMLPLTPPQITEGDEESHGNLDVLPPQAGDVASPQLTAGSPPRLFCSDTTGPALAKILRENNETILVATPEAGNQLDEASKPASLFGQLLLKGYSGDKAEIDRATKQPVILNQPCITVCWLCQPHRVTKFFGSERLMEDGLIARFLFVETKAGMPYMPEEDRTIPVSVINGYGAIMSELYDAYRGRGGQAEIVRISDEVYNIMRDYHNDCVRQLQEVDNNLTFCIPRWTEQAWKIMLVLHAAEHGAKAHLVPVDRQTAKRAITLMRWYASEQSRVMGVATIPPQEIRLKRLLELLGDAPSQTLKLRDLENSHGFTKDEVSELAQMAPSVLKLENRKPKASGRPSPVIVLIGSPPETRPMA
jgi:Protein of unknown function (DUF3987)